MHAVDVDVLREHALRRFLVWQRKSTRRALEEAAWVLERLQAEANALEERERLIGAAQVAAQRERQQLIEGAHNEIMRTRERARTEAESLRAAANAQRATAKREAEEFHAMAVETRTRLAQLLIETLAQIEPALFREAHGHQNELAADLLHRLHAGGPGAGA
jgi:hypothetical protein